MQTGDQSETIAFLTAAGGRERHETHISLIFLSAGLAWKLKRAVRLPYADFSTPDLRLAACRKELALNRDAAPGLYRNERGAFLPFLVAAPLLFLLGAALVYFVMLPFVMWFSLSQQIVGDGIQANLLPKVSDYLSLVTALLLAFGARGTPGGATRMPQTTRQGHRAWPRGSDP